MDYINCKDGVSIRLLIRVLDDGTVDGLDNSFKFKSIIFDEETGGISRITTDIDGEGCYLAVDSFDCVGTRCRFINNDTGEEIELYFNDRPYTLEDHPNEVKTLFSWFGINNEDQSEHDSDMPDIF